MRIWWIVWLPLTLMVVQAPIAGAMVALSVEPYYQERKLGYTTWPSGSGLHQSTLDKPGPSR